MRPGANGSATAVPPGVLWKMIDAFHDGVALADDGGMLVLANGRLEEMFGYARGELTGQPVERLIPADRQASHRHHLAAYSRAPRVRPMGTGAQLTGLRQDGSTFPAEISLSPVHTAMGRFVLTVVRDVSPADDPGDLAGHATRPDPRGEELLGSITAALYHVGLSLQLATRLPHHTARQRIQEALDAIDDTITEIRAAAFVDRDR